MLFSTLLPVTLSLNSLRYEKKKSLYANTLIQTLPVQPLSYIYGTVLVSVCKDICLLTVTNANALLYMPTSCFSRWMTLYQPNADELRSGPKQGKERQRNAKKEKQRYKMKSKDSGCSGHLIIFNARLDFSSFVL